MEIENFTNCTRTVWGSRPDCSNRASQYLVTLAKAVAVVFAAVLDLLLAPFILLGFSPFPPLHKPVREIKIFQGNSEGQIQIARLNKEIPATLNAQPLLLNSIKMALEKQGIEVSEEFSEKLAQKESELMHLVVKPLIYADILTQANFEAVFSKGEDFVSTMTQFILWLHKANLLTPENRNAIVALNKEALMKIRGAIEMLYEAGRYPLTHNFFNYKNNPYLLTQDYFNAVVCEEGVHASDIAFAIKGLGLNNLFSPENINTIVTRGGGKYARSIAQAIVELNTAGLLTPENTNTVLTEDGKYANFIANVILKHNANLLTIDTRNGLIRRVCRAGKDISDIISDIMSCLGPRFLPQVNFDGIIAGSDADLEDIFWTLGSLYLEHLHFMVRDCDVLTGEGINAIFYNRDVRLAIKTLSEYRLLTRANVRAILYEKGTRASRFFELLDKEMKLNGVSFNQEVFDRIICQIEQEEYCDKIARTLGRWSGECSVIDDHHELRIPLEIIQDIATLGPFHHESWKYWERIEISVREEEQAQIDKKEAKSENAV